MTEENENMDPASDGEANDATGADPNTGAENLAENMEAETDPEAARSRRKPRVPKLYPGARKDLYPTCTLMWTSCQENLSAFERFSPSYDRDLMDDRFQLIKTVRALPDETERAEPHRTAYDAAVEACKAYCEGWQVLKRYIARAKYSSESAKLDLAGQKNYTEASRYSWSFAEALVAAADKFMASHLESLLANRNMPPTFPAELTALGVAFNAKLSSFRNFEKGTEELTDQKMTAENDLYSKTTEMGQDGQEIFKKEPAKARLFSYAAMLETVSGVGSASILGSVTEEGNDQPIGNANVTVSGKGLATTTTTTGKFSIKQVASGTYTLIVGAPGFLPQTITGVAVEPGTAKRLNVKLQRA